MTTNPTQHCDHCGIGPFFLVAGREYPTLCLDCADIASTEGLLTWIDGKGTVWFPSSEANALIRADEAKVRVGAHLDALDATNHARDLEIEHHDGSWRDRD